MFISWVLYLIQWKNSGLSRFGRSDQRAYLAQHWSLGKKSSTLFCLAFPSRSRPYSLTSGAGFRAGRSFSHAMHSTGLKGYRPVGQPTVWFCSSPCSRPYGPTLGGPQGRSLVSPCYSLHRPEGLSPCRPDYGLLGVVLWLRSLRKDGRVWGVRRAPKSGGILGSEKPVTRWATRVPISG